MSTTSRAARLAIGTAQFGLAYGIANQGGQVAVAEAAAILRHGREAGIDTIDTAIAYGQSETRLGEIGVAGWKVITKLPAVPDDVADVKRWVRGAVEDSRRRLGVELLYGLMLHRPAQLLGPRGQELHRAILATREEGLTEKVGYSIYEPAELDSLAATFPPDIVQAPFNPVDRRLGSSGWLARLTDMGAEVHVRSIFLQGLLLLPPEKRGPRFSTWDALWKGWASWLTEANITPLEACVAFALGHERIDRVVVGVDSVAQLDEIVSASGRRLAPSDFPATLQSNDIQLINPATWTS